MLLRKLVGKLQTVGKIAHPAQQLHGSQMPCQHRVLSLGRRGREKGQPSPSPAVSPNETAANPGTILAVDDEPLVLSAYQRSLGDRFKILTAEGPQLALSALRSGSFAVVLTDLKMPGMDGIALLQAVREMQPDAVRMLISGHADLNDAINSVNNAGIFRLMIKPCPSENIAIALESGLEQHRLITAEKELLDKTLNGAIQAIMDILAMMDAEAFGQAQLRRRLAREAALALKIPTWECEMAAQLAEIGRATLPPSLNEKMRQRKSLSPAEEQLVQKLPEFSQRLLVNIPRIEGVAKAVLYQDKDYDGGGFPDDFTVLDEIPLSARVLHAINALMKLWHRGVPAAEALSSLRADAARYDPRVVAALHPCLPLLQGSAPLKTHSGPMQVGVADLAAGMRLLSDITTKDGVVVLGSGTQMSAAQVQRTKNFAQLNPVSEPILVEYAD